MRRALTLIELLVVIVILTIITAAAIPMMSPTNDDRRMREGARVLNAYITRVANKAYAVGRPCGVMLQRLSQNTKNPEDNAVCIQVFDVEEPEPFSGFDESSSARIALDNSPNARPLQVLIQFVRRGGTLDDQLPSGWDFDQIPPAFLKWGDVIAIGGTKYRFIDTTEDVDAQGFYTPQAGEPDGTLVAVPLNDTGQLLNAVDHEIDSARPDIFWTLPYRYAIRRQPTPSAVPPLQMVDGTAIDLRASGIGAGDFFYVPGVIDNTDPVVIMFTPDGRVSQVLMSWEPTVRAVYDPPIVDNVFLMVGRRENCPPPSVDRDESLLITAMSAEKREAVREPVNWLRGESRWVVLGTRNGRVVTSPNDFVTLDDPFIEGTGEVRRTRQISLSRTFARAMISDAR